MILVFFFPLHPSVLEPNLDLPLGEAKSMGDFYSSSPGEVAIKVELLLKFQGLVSGIGLSSATPLRT